MFGFGRKGRALQKKDVGLTDRFAVWLFGGRITASKMSVGESAAMQCTASRAAISLISDVLGFLPCHLYARADDGKRRADSHVAERLMSGFVAPWLSATEFRREMTYRAIHDGCAYARVIRVDGELRELQMLPRSAVKRDVDAVTGEPGYELHFADNRTERLDWREVLELRPLAGRSLRSDNAEAIGVALSLEKHTAEFFANGAWPAFAATSKIELSDDAYDRMSKSWDRWRSDLPSAEGEQERARNGGIILLEQTELQQLTLSSVDAQFEQLRRFQVTEVARGFRVPPPFLADLGSATYKNAEEMNRQFAQFTILPWAEAWKTALERTLLTEEERESHYFEFSLDDLARADLRARFEAYFRATGGSWMTANQVRALDDMPPIPGGDVLRTPLNTAPAAGKEPSKEGERDDE